jgi:hypothetical protein
MTRSTLLALLLALLPAAAPLTISPAAASACGGSTDFDGDGVDDVAVGDPFAGGRGAVHVLSGGKVIPVSVPRPADGDGFGWSVRLTRINDDACADLVVGAPYTDVEGSVDAGSVHIVYGGGAAPPQRVVASQPQRGARFGWSLTGRDDLVVIGAPYEDEGTLADTGAVYVRDGGSELRRISQQSADVRGNGEVGDQFGWSLAMGPGNGLVVGVPYENDDGDGRQVDSGKVDSGSVVVVRDVLAARLASVKLDSPTDTSGDRFGYAVAWVTGAGPAVGAPGPGYVQLYDAELAAKARVPNAGEDTFGFALAASDDGRLAIGAPYGGSVRIVNGTDGKDERRFARQDGLFGWSLAFSGNKLYAGRPDGGPFGTVMVAARNSDGLRQVLPSKGADFGGSLAG